MTLLVLVILAVIWAAVLLPPYLQNRSESRPADSISTFRNQLSVLERRSTMVTPSGPTPRRAVQPARAVRPGMGAPMPAQAQRARLARMEAKRRRRDILLTLLAASGLTLVLGLVMAPVLLLHLAIDVLLGAYVALLVRQRRIAEERSVKVRYLAPTRSSVGSAGAVRGSQPQPQLALRRSANG